MVEGDAAGLARDLRFVDERASLWFDDAVGPFTATTSWTSRRAQSSLHGVRLRSARGADRHLVIKRTMIRDLPERPRLGLDRDVHRKHRLEAAALGGLYDAIEAAERPDLRAVRVLEVLPDGLVMTADQGRSLASTIRRRHGLGVVDHVVRAGRLLAVFHGMATEAIVVRSRAEQIAAAFEDYSTFLGLDRDPQFGDEIVGLSERLQADVERRPPCTGLGHGDFAPRNLLVDEEGAALIDALGVQCCPIEEDLASFALALRRGTLIPWAGAFSERRAERLEAALLDGYGRHRIDPFRYQAFSVLVILDAMAADAVRPSAAPAAPIAIARRSLPSLSTLLVDRIDRARRTVTHRSGA